eukprot:scaffold690_cov327-Pavlova_lutheri.AAC.11
MLALHGLCLIGWSLLPTLCFVGWDGIPIAAAVGTRCSRNVTKCGSSSRALLVYVATREYARSSFYRGSTSRVLGHPPVIFPHRAGDVPHALGQVVRNCCCERRLWKVGFEVRFDGHGHFFAIESTEYHRPSYSVFEVRIVSQSLSVFVCRIQRLFQTHVHFGTSNDTHVACFSHDPSDFVYLSFRESDT